LNATAFRLPDRLPRPSRLRRRLRPKSEITEIAEAPVSDELPGLPGAATGIAFWDHPRLSFNSTLIVATSAGVVSYNMEDGNEVSRIDGFNADGVAAGYLGEGAQAAGFIAFLDADENQFRFYGIDNESRAFIPLEGAPSQRGAVRGYCMGRGPGVEASSLYVIQKGKVDVFNLAATEGGITVENETKLETPDNLISCELDIDGRLLVASDKGEIYRIDGEDAFRTPLARSGAAAAAVLSVIGARIVSENPDDAPASTGQILLADLSNGVIHVFESLSGNSLGAVKISATDELSAVDGGEAFSASAANFGGLYRNGVVAFGVANGADGPVISLMPVSSLRNALSLPVGEPVSSRRETTEVNDSDLIIEPSFTPQ
jgi:hypothetical protein